MCFLVCGEGAYVQRYECLCNTRFFLHLSYNLIAKVWLNTCIIMIMTFLYPPQTKLGVYRNHFIRPPVCLWWNIGSYYLTIYFTQRLFMTWGCILILTQGYSVRFKVTQRMQNSCPVHIIFPLEKHWKFILKTNIAYDPWVCYGVNPW